MLIKIHFLLYLYLEAIKVMHWGLEPSSHYDTPDGHYDRHPPTSHAPPLGAPQIRPPAELTNRYYLI